MPRKKKEQTGNPVTQKVKIFLNDEEIMVDPNEYIIDIAKKCGIKIPHFCMHERLERTAACRLCIVETELRGMRVINTSCSTKPVEGMKVYTHTPRLLEARRINLELLLANHDLNCPTCPSNLGCKLQRYSSELMIEESRFTGIKREVPVDNSSVSIVRNDNRCILCGRCVRMCNDIQTVHAIDFQKRGFETIITPALDYPMEKSACVNCGQCVIVCPTGALSEKPGVQHVIDALNSGKMLIAQTAPSIRATLGECFGMEPGTNVTGKMVSALKKIGFEKVFDTDLGADITIIEEATEFVKRFKENRDLPLITTCCPAWIKFGEQFFFDELSHMSTCRSPQAILASLIKTYYAEKIGKKLEDIILVDIMPCTAKKYEILRPEFVGEADFVLTTVELGKLIKQMNIDFEKLPDTEFDNPLGESTGAGVIFGRSGGVMEAALRTAADWLEAKPLDKIEYKSIRGMETMKEAKLMLAGKEVRICVVHTLGEARKLLEQIKEGKSSYHFIEIMACYGGCIGGGGQPRPTNKERLLKRMEAINKEDKRKKVRKSHENPSALKIYKEYLGEFGGERAHKLLHTSYSKKPYK